MTSRRTHLLSVVACLAGAGLTLYAVTRVWSVQVEHRTGLSDLRTEQTGAESQPWLIGLALVALAGTGALLATRGRVRRGLGVLLTLIGAGIVAGAALARLGLDAGDAGASAAIWPFLCVLGGAAVAVGGVLAARHGHLWSAMSSRYERSTAPQVSPEKAQVPESPADTRALWDALDRGDDPTVR
ncbi:putative membrane protein (TIGR02234 family) [Actinoplanes lutulentus]|uniref:Putative membrane protein (TIGR02234 family) n=1 Tax=Actinoplanes lutulentus TaxID=1287878 RepID=A0A327ZEX4_9ACTN|nr:Trp biosynthesis-associated membrane protein [Actinoplanes lutulentus]MBB2941564.1 putative membrane protein (TIGR02234 family) [Actinoplanes lutulentus]RAK39484.1 putative membrane protein (TIGR02234 family) [Actinoplanes lutulentus]